MEHDEFTRKFHWLNGLSEYFRATGQEEKYEPVFKALYHQNYYRKRDIIINMIDGKYKGIKKSSPARRRAWINMLLNEHMDDVEVKTDNITSLIATVSDDAFVNRICSFIDFFTVDHKTTLMLPDLGDFLSRGQVKSKIWMITELAHIIDGPVGNIVCYGGWYNFLAHFLFDQFEVDKITSIDIDDTVVGPCKRLYAAELDDNRFNAFTADVSKLQWRDQNDLWYHDFDKRDEQITAWMEGQEQNLTDKRQILIDQWIQKQEDSLTVKRQILIDQWMQKQECSLSEKRQQLINTWLEKQEEKYAADIEANEDEIRIGYTSKKNIREDIFRDKDQVIEKISEDVRTGMFKDKEAVFEKISEDLRAEMFKNKDSIFENYGWRRLDKFNMVINTSCEHMNNDWFDNLPDGTLVVLQTNDYFENKQHSNCCNNLADAKDKYPMQSYFYEGKIDTRLYNRFMLIGVK